MTKYNGNTPFDELLEAIKKNDKNLFKLKRIPMTAEQVGQLSIAIKTNTELHGIEWNIIDDPKSKEIEQLKFDIEEKLKYNSQYYYYPDDHILSLLSLHAYEVFYKKLIKGTAVTLFSDLDSSHRYKNWRILEIISPEEQKDNSYFGVIYTNDYYLVLSHRGTVYFP